jgi:hypothetical protein
MNSRAGSTWNCTVVANARAPGWAPGGPRVGPGRVPAPLGRGTLMEWFVRSAGHTDAHYAKKAH